MSEVNQQQINTNEELKKGNLNIKKGGSDNKAYNTNPPQNYKSGSGIPSIDNDYQNIKSNKKKCKKKDYNVEDQTIKQKNNPHIMGNNEAKIRANQPDYNILYAVGAGLLAFFLLKK